VNDRIEIGKVSVEPGRKGYGFLKIGETSPVVPIKLPFMIVNGIKEGPRLCLMAGEHTAELSGVMSIIRVLQELDPKELSGGVIGVPNVNILGFPFFPTEICPLDRKNINRIFPGKPDGSISKRLAYTLFNEIILKADYLIDLHDVGEWNYGVPFAIWHKTGKKEVDRVSESLAKYWCTKIVVVTRRPYDKGQSYAEASEQGKPAALNEAAEAKDVGTHYKGIINVMKYLGMIVGRPEIPTNQEPFQGGFEEIRVDRGGVFYPILDKVGKMVSEGEIVATVKSVFGETLEEVRAPKEGILIHMKWGAIVNTGDNIGELGLKWKPQVY